MGTSREFLGVWIPREVWLDERLNMLEKGILVEITSLDKNETGCYASNKYLANFCQCSETKVSTAISKLIELGYLYIKNFDGRQRILKSRLSNFEGQTRKNCKADSQKLQANNKYNNISNNKNIYKEKYKKEKFIPNDRNFVENFERDMKRDPNEKDTDEVF